MAHAPCCPRSIGLSSPPSQETHFIKWGLSIVASVGLTGMLRSRVPMVFFIFGLVGGVYAVSSAEFFYEAHEAPGAGAFLSLEPRSGWSFDAYTVPAQQQEPNIPFP